MMKFLKNFWNWLLGQTTIDEKIEAKVIEAKEEIAEAKEVIKEATKKIVEEAQDVVAVVESKKKRYYKPKAKKQ
jgi:hypothetical protein